jgi:hypothetical protein
MKFKIVRKSNYDYDDWRGDQKFVTDYVFSELVADTICAAMNVDQYRSRDDYFVVVPHDYVLPKPWSP